MRSFGKVISALVIVFTLVIVGTVVIKTYGYNLKFNSSLSNITSGAKDALKNAASDLSDAMSHISDLESKAASASDSGQPPAIPNTTVTTKPDSNQSQSSVSAPIAADDLQSVWGKTGMDGLTVYEYGKSLLNNDEKEAYCRIAEAARNLDNSVTVKTKITPIQAKKVYEYYVYDHSENFYMKGIDLEYSSLGSNYTYKFSFEYKYSDKNKIMSMREKLRKNALDILNSVKDLSTDYKKEKAIHDSIVKLCSYDLAAAENPTAYPDSYTAYGALVNNKAVCGGYAQSMKILLSSAGIKTLYITGQANGDSHAWNLVQIGGNWRYVDATFDDPVFTNSKGEYVSYNTVSYTYFNFKSKADHVEGTFDSSDPFSDSSENYEKMPNQ